MKKFIIFGLLCSFIVYVPIKTSAVSAVAYILYDHVSETVLFSHNKDKKMPMASTTKIMTCIIALENAVLSDEVTVTNAMVMVEGTSTGLRAGDKITIETLLYGLMLESGNDAANTLALHIAGSQKDFAVLMNQKAREIGMTNSNFVTPSGLDAENHYTTAYDMAKLTAYAMKNDVYRSITVESKQKVVYNNGETKRTYYNHNRLLKQCEGVDSGKTGFTKKSGRCLVTSCVRNGVRLIAVTLNAGDDWNDHKILYNEGYKKYSEAELDKPALSKIPVVGGDINMAELKTEAIKSLLLHGDKSKVKANIILPKFIYAEVKNGQQIGYIEYTINENVIATSPIITTIAVPKTKTKKQNYTKKVLYWFIALLRI